MSEIKRGVSLYSFQEEFFLRKMTLEDALEYIGDDELVEITPASIRLRKKILEPGMRK